MVAVGIAVAAGTTMGPNFDPHAAAPLARAMIEGVILGSNTWPSAPVDVQARLQLRPTGCDATGGCVSSED
jgi:hypothetical protein